MNITLLPIGGLMIGFLGTTLASERFVPQGGSLNYPTIQAAIAASTSGDIIRVQPGVYRESISFRSLDITLTSTDPTNPQIVQSTVIQGDGTNSVVSIAGGQTTNALLTGFTIRGGGSTVINIDVGRLFFGSGIYCSQSSPSIIGNVIEDNHLAITNSATFGGGIACLGGGPHIARNILRNNSAFTGGGIESDSGTPLIENNWIYSNVAVVGGGVLLIDHSQFINNTVVANSDDNLDVELTALVMNNIIALAPTGIGVAIGPRAAGFPNWFQSNDTWGNEGGDLLQFSQLESRSDRSLLGSPLAVIGINGNISLDPRFVSVPDSNFRLAADSPCVNSGSALGVQSANELDIDGAPRVFARWVDLGAAERHEPGDYPPRAGAGLSRTIDWNGTDAVVLDGSGSADPNGAPLQFVWRQVDGPPVTLTDSAALASFMPLALGEYRFELVVKNATLASAPATVQIVVTNLPPIASAGLLRNFPTVPDMVSLDGSHSMDPEGQPIRYQWRQTAGPAVSWVNTDSARPSFHPAGPGAYKFELVVSDAFQGSVPAQFNLYLGSVLPVANAGQTRYAGRKPVTLDGSASFALNNPAPLEYAWRQLSGPPLILQGTNTAVPVVSGFQQLANQIQQATFELVVRADGRTSAPDNVTIVIVPAWRSSDSMSLLNPPFDPHKPTVVGFGGGNCDSGDPQSFPANWLSLANVFTMSYSRDADSSLPNPVYRACGDQLITLLSAAAPAYDQAIQTIGFSTGNMPACDVAEQLNTEYRDPRYLVNRVTLLDTGCNLDRYTTNIGHLNANRVPGKSFWIENYYSAARQVRPGTLNLEFPVPPAQHSTPVDWYFTSWNMAAAAPTNFNQGVFAGAYFSVVGPGKNDQVETGQSGYYFGWPQANSTSFPLSKLVQLSPFAYPARLPGPVFLEGPDSGEWMRPGQGVFSCQPVLNAVTYQVLVGPAPRQLDWVAWEGAAPPQQALRDLPFPITYWTVRAVDAYGTTSQADPRYVYRDTDGGGLSNEIEVFVYPLTDNQFMFNWFARASIIYSVEFSPTLSPASWQTIETLTAAPADGFVQHVLTRPLSALGFFRVEATAP